MEFKDAQIGDVVRIIAEASELNIVATNEAAVKRVTLYLHHVSARQALEIISKIGGLWYRHDPAVNVYRLMTTEEYQKDLVVFREEKTRIFQLLYPNPVSISTAIRDLYGDRVKYSQAQSGDTLATLGGGSGGGSGSAGGQSGSSGQFSRDSSSTGGNFSRQTGSDFVGGQSSSSGGGGENGQSRRMLDEKLTVDQIDALEQRGGEKGVVSSEQLKGISRQEQDIFIVVVPDQNTVAVRTGDLEAMDNIASLIEQLDKPTSEVLLEMKVLDLTLGDSFHSIFDVKLADGKTTFGLGNFANLSGPTLVYQFLDDHIRANIELLSRENRVDVLATPLLMASNNRPAQLFIGEEKVLITDVDSNTVTPATGAAVTTIDLTTEVRNVGNTLRILPKINADRTITLNVQQDTSSVLPKSTNIPVSVNGGKELQEFAIDTVNTANLNATVVAKDGMTVAIGGMIRTSITNDIQKVPLLGDIPYLGALFSREIRDKKKTELVLLITPHVMMAPTEAASVSSRVAKPLSDHPYFTDGDSAYEYHFDKLKPEGVDDRPWAQPPNPHVPRSQSKPPMAAAGKQTPEAPGLKQIYAELTRFAAKSARQPVAPGEVPEGIRMEILRAELETPLLTEAGVDVTPLQSWRKGDLYVTSVQLKNRLRLPVTVNHTRLHGRWLAATIEKSALAGQGETGDSTYLYVISSEPFHQALSH